MNSVDERYNSEEKQNPTGAGKNADINKPSKHNCNLLAFWKTGLILAVSVVAALIAPEDFTSSQRIMTAIFVAAAGLWVTELVPPFATAILVVFGCVYLLGQPGGVLGFKSDRDYLIFINPVADPVIVLFFGGFILAIAATKYGLEKILASFLLRPFAGSPNKMLFGVILVTGAFSMFMSNTATALMMITILRPVLKNISDEGLRVKLALAVAFAANIGGMGTIIGTPPNAIAVSVLAKVGIKVTFLSWMIVGIPTAVVLLLVLWAVLCILHPTKTGAERMVFEKHQYVPGIELWIVAGTFLTTIALWMSEALHGLSPAVVALLPLTIFTATGLLTASDLKSVEWDVLILVAGGLALGVGLQTTGLSGKIVSLVPMKDLPLVLVFIILAAVTVFLSNFMSNTSAANILIPISASLGTISPVMCAIGVALCASLGMSLPISTPPNAVVYATGILKSHHMIIAGTTVSFCGVAIIILLFYMGFDSVFAAL